MGEYKARSGEERAYCGCIQASATGASRGSDIDIDIDIDSAMIACSHGTARARAAVAATATATATVTATKTKCLRLVLNQAVVNLIVWATQCRYTRIQDANPNPNRQQLSCCENRFFSKDWSIETTVQLRTLRGVIGGARERSSQFGVSTQLEFGFFSFGHLVFSIQQSNN
jgi:hypothetical protein